MTITHNGHNQLGIVIGFQDLLKRYTTLDEQSHDWLETSNVKLFGNILTLKMPEYNIALRKILKIPRCSIGLNTGI